MHTPRMSIGDGETNVIMPVTLHDAPDSPEKKITLFAMRLALLEKIASRLGALTFVWATVVLLGGFATTLAPRDFWVVTVILVFEGTRIFCRSHELEWENNISMEIHSHSSVHPPPPRGSRSTGSVDLLTLSGWIFVAKNVKGYLFIMQIVLALTCEGLSLWRLVFHNYGKSSDATSQNNKVSAIIIFYVMSLLEAFLFILQKVAWQWKIVQKRLFSVVSDEFGFDESFGPQAVTRFFYDSYGKAVTGSIFDSIKMDFLSFGMDLLMQSSPDTRAHLAGASILKSLAMDDRFKEDALRLLGTRRDVMEKLIEVLCWKNPEERQIRKHTAEIILCLVGKKRNGVPVAAIGGCFEAVSSLLYDDQAFVQDTDGDGMGRYDFVGFTVTGLKILNHMAKDVDNCSNIAGTRGLLVKIVNTVRTRERRPVSSQFSLDVVEESLELLNRLASSSSMTGQLLRNGILENVSTISNIRNVIVEFRAIPKIQTLAIETLRSLALEENGREIIGSTGGVLTILVNVFFDDSADMELASKAGEAISRLTIDNMQNCRILRGIGQGNHVERLLQMLEDRARGVCAARILRRLCIFMKEGEQEPQAVKREMSKIVRIMMNEEEVVRQEAIIGVVAHTLQFLDFSELENALEKGGCNIKSVILKMVEILKLQEGPSQEAPCIRRFCLMVVSLLCEGQKDWADAKLRGDLREALVKTLETTSHIENYCTFSGSVGLNLYKVSIRDLVCEIVDKFPDCPFALSG